MDAEVAVERACQQAIKYLLNEPEFLRQWQLRVAEKLENSRNPGPSSVSLADHPSSSSSSLGAQTLQTAVEELTSTIDYVISIFHRDVDIRNFSIGSETRTAPNRDASSLFEAGLKVEKLANLNLEEIGEEAALNQISAACRRVSQCVKAFGKRFQNQNMEIRQILNTSNRLCQLFYSISSEILKISKKFKKLSRKVREAADEFNLKVIAELEEIEKELKIEEKRKNRRPRTAPTPFIRNSNFSKNPPENSRQTIQKRREHRLTTSIQQAVIQKSNSEDVRRLHLMKGKTHVAGSIATSIISKRRGFLIEDSLARARERVPRVAHIPRQQRHPPQKTSEIPEAPKHRREDVVNSSEDVEINYDVKKSAREVTQLVIEEMRHKMRIGNDERILLAVQK